MLRRVDMVEYVVQASFHKENFDLFEDLQLRLN